MNLPWYWLFIIIVGIVIFGIIILGFYDKYIKKKVDENKKNKDFSKDNPFITKKYDKNSEKNLSSKQKKITTKNKSEFEQIKDFNKSLQKTNKQYLGVYNYFGTKTSMRLKPLVFVQEKKDSCYLCQPWENKILSLDHEDNSYQTMAYAISLGYHHVGCTHEDVDYLIRQSRIEKNYFSIAEKNKNFALRLKQFSFEKKIRDLKIEIKKYPNQVDKIKKNLDFVIKNYLIFLKENKMNRNIKREDINVNDNIIFS